MGKGEMRKDKLQNGEIGKDKINEKRRDEKR